MTSFAKFGHVRVIPCKHELLEFNPTPIREGKFTDKKYRTEVKKRGTDTLNCECVTKVDIGVADSLLLM